MNGNFAARTHPLIVLASLTSLILGEKETNVFHDYITKQKLERRFF